MKVFLFYCVLIALLKPIQSKNLRDSSLQDIHEKKTTIDIMQEYSKSKVKRPKIGTQIG
jgi:hypothetical protein